MNHLNSVLLEGIVSREGIMTSTARGTKVCNFEIGSDRYERRTDETMQKSTSYFHVEMYGKRAELGELLKQGQPLRVVGWALQDRWKDEYGKPHSRIKIIAELVELRPRTVKTVEE